MCYLLYGCINKEADIDDYNKISNNSGFNFKPGEKQKIIDCINNSGNDFYLTENHCDCGTAIGTGKPGKQELKDLRDHINELAGLKNVKHIYLSKCWYGEKCSGEQTVHIQDIDIIPFLAEVKESCLYKIQLFKKYY